MAEEKLTKFETLLILMNNILAIYSNNGLPYQ